MVVCECVCYPTAGIQHLEPLSRLVAATRVTAVGGQFPPLPVLSPSPLLLPTVHLLPPPTPALLALMQLHDWVLLAVDRWAFTWNHSLRQERPCERPCCVEVVPVRGTARRERKGLEGGRRGLNVSLLPPLVKRPEGYLWLFWLMESHTFIQIILLSFFRYRGRHSFQSSFSVSQDKKYDTLEVWREDVCKSLPVHLLCTCNSISHMQ